ncbi:MAG: hypothetical protein ACAH24_10035 [Hyphomicrobiaceae bacterium]
MSHADDFRVKDMGNDELLCSVDRVEALEQLFGGRRRPQTMSSVDRIASFLNPGMRRITARFGRS